MSQYFNASGQVREIDDALMAEWMAAGNPKAQGWTPVPPPTPEQIAQALARERESIWGQIKAIRDRKTQQGGYQVAGKWFHSDTFSRTQQIGLTIMGAAIPAGMLWKTMDGSFVEMTPTLAQQVFVAAGQQDAALFAYAEQLRAQVQAAQDPASIDLEAGWPVTYDRV